MTSCVALILAGFGEVHRAPDQKLTANSCFANFTIFLVDKKW